MKEVLYMDYSVFPACNQIQLRRAQIVQQLVVLLHSFSNNLINGGLVIGILNQRKKKQCQSAGVKLIA